jgi:DNA mismatch endonuclease (patch repair protein)
MADVHNKETRSYNKSQIKGKNTKPEMLILKDSYGNGFLYILYDKEPVVKPYI